MTKYKIQIDPDAFNDIQKAISWYNSQQKGLGKRFRSNVEKQINALKKIADIFEVKYNSDVHWIKVNKFPYTIHYRVVHQNKTVQVIGVFYAARKPQVWENRKK